MKQPNSMKAFIVYGSLALIAYFWPPPHGAMEFPMLFSFLTGCSLVNWINRGAQAEKNQ